MKQRFAIFEPIAKGDNQGNQSTSWLKKGFVWGKITAERARPGSDLSQRFEDEFSLELFDCKGLGIAKGWRLVAAGTSLLVSSVEPFALDQARITAKLEGTDAL